MISEPVELDRSITLVVEQPLDKAQRQAWRACVAKHAPPGVVTTVQLKDDDGEPHVVAMVGRESKRGHGYSIPLARDLRDGEVERVVQAFAADHPDLDFEIETTAVEQMLKPDDRISVDQDKHLQMCQALAKQQHEAWVRERTDAGWRYGTKFSSQDKTHPLLQPWHELPDRFKKPNLDWPETLVRMLAGQGYAVVAKDDLARMMSTLRSLA